jgi:hypothetical protein
MLRARCDERTVLDGLTSLRIALRSACGLKHQERPSLWWYQLVKVGPNGCFSEHWRKIFTNT